MLELKNTITNKNLVDGLKSGVEGTEETVCKQDDRTVALTESDYQRQVD